MTEVESGPAGGKKDRYLTTLIAIPRCSNSQIIKTSLTKSMPHLVFPVTRSEIIRVDLNSRIVRVIDVFRWYEVGYVPDLLVPVFDNTVALSMAALNVETLQTRQSTNSL